MVLFICAKTELHMLILSQLFIATYLTAELWPSLNENTSIIRTYKVFDTFYQDCMRVFLIPDIFPPNISALKRLDWLLFYMDIRIPRKSTRNEVDQEIFIPFISGMVASGSSLG